MADNIYYFVRMQQVYANDGLFLTQTCTIVNTYASNLAKIFTFYQLFLLLTRLMMKRRCYNDDISNFHCFYLQFLQGRNSDSLVCQQLLQRLRLRPLLEILPYKPGRLAFSKTKYRIEQRLDDTKFLKDENVSLP